MRWLLLLFCLGAAHTGFATTPTLYLYNWNNYISAATLTRFETRCACKVVQDYYSDNEEMLAKLAAGAAGVLLLLQRRAHLLGTDQSVADQQLPQVTNGRSGGGVEWVRGLAARVVQQRPQRLQVGRAGNGGSARTGSSANSRRGRDSRRSVHGWLVGSQGDPPWSAMGRFL